MEAQKVIFADLELEKDFNNLPKNDWLKPALENAFEQIRKNPRIGRLIDGDGLRKKGIKSYLKKYDINSIRIYNLPKAYRLLYNVSADQIEVIVIILDWKSHPDYDKLEK